MLHHVRCTLLDNANIPKHRLYLSQQVIGWGAPAVFNIAKVRRRTSKLSRGLSQTKMLLNPRLS